MRKKRIYKQKRKHVDLNKLGPILKIALDNFTNNLNYTIRSIGSQNAGVMSTSNYIPRLSNLSEDNEIWINNR